MTTRRISPTVRRRRLAKILRDRRAELGRTRGQAAEYVGVGAVTITRIESPTEGRPKLADVERYAHFLEFDETETEELVQLARECKIKGWWQRLGGTFQDGYLTYIGLEEEAGELMQFMCQAIPGLLQTRDYQRALLAAELHSWSKEETEEKIEARQTRQSRRLKDDPVECWFVFDEACLRRRVGDDAVMREQLDHLVDVSRLDNVQLQILPFANGPHPALAAGSFTVLRFPDQRDPAVVYREVVSGLFLEDEEQVRMHIRLFDQLKAHAAGPAESRELIRAIAVELPR